MRLYAYIQNKKGFSLIEVLAAIVIMSTILVGFISFLPNLMKTADKNEVYTKNIQAADAALQFIKTQEFPVLLHYWNEENKDSSKNTNKPLAIITSDENIINKTLPLGTTLANGDTPAGIKLFINRIGARDVLAPENKENSVYVFLARETPSVKKGKNGDTDGINERVKNYIRETLHKKFTPVKLSTNIPVQDRNTSGSGVNYKDYLLVYVYANTTGDETSGVLLEGEIFNEYYAEEISESYRSNR